MKLPVHLLHRRLQTHKGDYGHILIIAGCARFSGAAVLCGAAAARSGAGLVTLGIPRGINSAVIKIKLPELMTLPLPETKEHFLTLASYDIIRRIVREKEVLVIGPGLGQRPSTVSLVRKVVTAIDCPMVVDADGLNALAGRMRLFEKNKNDRIVFTPHPGEMERLLGVPAGEIQKKRRSAAQEFAKKYRLTLVLKGHATVVADFTGRSYVNTTGNPGMATAGSGDVLSGIIASFMGQGLSPFEAAKYAVYLHGLAGDLAAREKTQMGMIASDIIAKIPEAIKRCS